mmetsp:Transcript_144606/g.351122  ORF Transcript_144606/g.351122 Transcript_144606/m.351122 type:complete len:216 (-) Transcript_144606:449-1096(-)
MMMMVVTTAQFHPLLRPLLHCFGVAREPLLHHVIIPIRILVPEVLLLALGHEVPPGDGRAAGVELQRLGVEHLAAAALLRQEGLDVPVASEVRLSKGCAAVPPLEIDVLALLQELLDLVYVALVGDTKPAQGTTLTLEEGDDVLVAVEEGDVDGLAVEDVLGVQVRTLAHDVLGKLHTHLLLLGHRVKVPEEGRRREVQRRVLPGIVRQGDIRAI